MAIGICVYCGFERELTDDHVPPRSFYGKTPPLNLITVPSCAECNRGFNVDDDYVRLVLASDEKAKGIAERDELIPAIKRYSQRRESRRSLADFYESLDGAYHRNAQGVFVWAQHHTVDGKRMDAFAVRIVKGLFFREKGYRLPDGYEVQAVHRVRIPLLLESPEYGDFAQFILAKLMDEADRKSWGEVFAYSWVQSPNGPEQTWWLLEFYRTVEYLCSTWNPSTGGVPPVPSYS